MQTQNTEKAPGRLASWLAYVRPKTWGVAVAPVLASLSLYVSEHHSFHWDVAFFTLTIAVLMQIITNMQNDRGYTQRKLEKGNRRGLPRATANGWISMKACSSRSASLRFLRPTPTWAAPSPSPTRPSGSWSS